MAFFVEEQFREPLLHELENVQDASLDNTCENCSSYNTQILDYRFSEVICTACGCVSNNADNFNQLNEMIKTLYEHNQDLSSQSTGSGSGSGVNLSGAGNSLITSFDNAMDFSKNGILSGRMSNLDSNNRRIGQSYSKLSYIEKNSLKNTSTNREVNITEGLSTILKIIDKLKIPKFIGERAANIFRMFYPKDRSKKIKYVNITNLLNQKRKLGSDKNISAKFVSITCIYFALRESEEITSLIEFVNIITKNDCIDSKIYTKDVVKKIINKIYCTMVNQFGLKIVYPDTGNTINHICNTYCIDENIKRDSMELYDVINNNIAVFQGTAPRTIAIVLIYISYIRNDKIPRFIKRTDLSIITLKKLYNKYLENLYNVNQINDNEFGLLKDKLDNGYKNKILNQSKSLSK